MAGLTIYYNNHLLSIVGMVSMAVGIATYAFTTTTWAVYICEFKIYFISLHFHFVCPIVMSHVALPAQ